VLGILVHGDNHFIVQGPQPSREVVLELVRLWSVIQIGAMTPPHLEGWKIISKAFREDLEWAVVVGENGRILPAVATLLQELSARGVPIRDAERSFWP